MNSPSNYTPDPYADDGEPSEDDFPPHRSKISLFDIVGVSIIAILLGWGLARAF